MWPFSSTTKLEPLPSSTGPALSKFCKELPCLARLGVSGEASSGLPTSFFLSNPHVSTLYSAVANFDSVHAVHYRRHTFVSGPPAEGEAGEGGQNTLDFASLEAVSAGEDAVPQDSTLPPRTRHMTAREAEAWGDDEHGVLLVLCHGLTGGSHESYIRATVEAVLDMHDTWTSTSTSSSSSSSTTTATPTTGADKIAGHEKLKLDVVCFNARGCARSKMTSRVFWNARRAEDMAASLTLLRKRYPQRKIVCAGFSLGGNILCNYLADYSASNPESFAGAAGAKRTALGGCGARKPALSAGECVDVAISVSNPWRLASSSRFLLGSHLGRLYSRGMTKNLVKLTTRHAAWLTTQPGVDLAKVRGSTYLPDFDGAFQCPAWGYASAEEYYDDASSAPRLAQIDQPLIILNAVDDPITGPEALPRAECAQNPNLALLATDRGGHIGWYGAESMPGKRHLPRRLFADLIVDVCEAQLDGKSAA